MKNPIHIATKCLVLSVFLGMVMPLHAGTVSKSIPVEYFDEIELHNATRLEITQGDKPSLKVTVESDKADRVQIKQRGDRLSLGYKGESGWFNWGGDGGEDVLFEVVVPDLTYLELDGASRAQSNVLSLDTLKLEISGASRLALGAVTFARLEGDISGASQLTVENLKGGDVLLGVSGASKTLLDTLIVELIRLDASGASQVHVRDSGSAAALHAIASGASKLDCGALVARAVKVDASGASRAEVHASETLEATTSGASNVEYAGEPKITRLESSGSISAK